MLIKPSKRTNIEQSDYFIFILQPVGLPFFISQRAQFATLTTRYRIPATYSTREDVEAGGLMSYGADNQESWRQVGIYTGQILKGAKPADLPVMQSTKF